MSEENRTKLRDKFEKETGVGVIHQEVHEKSGEVYDTFNYGINGRNKLNTRR